MSRKKIINYTLFGSIALILLYFSFRGIRWRDFFAGLKDAEYSWIGISMMIGVLSFYIRAVRWRLIIKSLGTTVSRLHAFDGINIAYLTNFALPRAGELARCGVIAKVSGLGFDSVVGTVVVERSFDILCLLFVTVLIMLLKIQVFGAFMYKQIWMPFLHSLGGSSLLAVGICLAVPAVIVLLLYLFRKSLRKSRFYRKCLQFLKGIWQGVKQSLRMPHKAGFLLLSLVLWFLFILTSYCTILAFPTAAGLNFADAVFLMVAGSLGWAVPVQGGFGSFHFIVSRALITVYGIAQTQSMVFATISHESQALAMLLCGIFSLIHLGASKRRKDANAAPPQPLPNSRK